MPRTIQIGPDDDTPQVLRELLALAENPRDIVYQTETNSVQVPDDVADAWFAKKDEDTAADTAPKKKGRPRKAVAAEAEESDGDN